ncbi:MAG: MFS transporter [Deltaproteobacteria bacterium]|nr:MFS transporter [Deltaproteobacteria bacterium]
MGSFTSSLATSIVGVVLPRIGAWSGRDVLDLQWVMLTPLVVIVAALLPAGRAGDVFGHRRAYLFGLVLLCVGSLGCALAPSFGTFLIGRAVQGFGSSFLMASSPALVSLGAAPGRRGRALGLISSALYLGLTLGPPLGGLLESWGGFRTVFWVQALLPAALLVLAVPLLPDVGRSEQAQPIDLAGAGLLASGLALVLLGASRWGAWGSAPSGGLALGGGLVLAVFTLRERRAVSPLLDLGLFSDRTFASAAAGAFLNYLAVSHVSFLLPFHLEEGLGLDPRHAGLVLTTMPLVMAILAGPSGTLSDRMGSRGLSSLGMALSTAGLVGFVAAVATGRIFPIVAAAACLGLGTGLFVSPNTNALLSSAPRERQGVASGVLAVARNLGMVSGTTLGAALYAYGSATLEARGASAVDASVHGLQWAFGVAACLALAGALVVLVRPSRESGPRSR